MPDFLRFKVNKRKGRVIHNGYNFDRNKILDEPSQVKQKLNILKDDLVVGMVGAFHKRKDYETYFLGAEEIIQSRKDIVFMAIGDGPNLKSFQEKYKNNNQILLPGRLNDIENIINIFDIGVLLSNPTIHLEGIPNAVMEMMSLEKPVIVSKGGGTDELVINRKSGLTITPKSVKEFVNGVMLLLEDPNFAKDLAISAKNRIKNSFSIENMGKETVQLYTEICSLNTESIIR